MKALARIVILLGLLLTQAGCVSVSPHAPPQQLPPTVLAQPERFILVTLRSNPTPPGSRAASTVRGYDTATPYVTGAKTHAVARALAARHDLREVQSWPIAALNVHCIVFEIPGGVPRETVLATLAHDPEVQLAQPLQTFTSASDPSYNDPYLDLQPSLRQMDVPAAHRWSRGRGIRVAIIDTGISSRHADLSGRVVATRNFIDADRESFERDRHGTEVAGIIAALADNSVGIVGVAPEVEILAYKACWQAREGADAALCNSFTLAQGLVAAIDARAHVINLSVNGPADPLLADLVAQAIRRGIVVVGAAMSSGAAGGFPASVPGVLAVDVARPENTPPAHFAAPGDDILTLKPGDAYGFASGSSLATAHVSGVVALLLSRTRGLSAAQIGKLLTSATQRIATPAGEFASINACAALAEMLSLGPCPPQTHSASL